MPSIRRRRRQDHRLKGVLNFPVDPQPGLAAKRLSAPAWLTTKARKMSGKRPVGRVTCRARGRGTGESVQRPSQDYRCHHFRSAMHEQRLAPAGQHLALLTLCRDCFDNHSHGPFHPKWWRVFSKWFAIPHPTQRDNDLRHRAKLLRGHPLTIRFHLMKAILKLLLVFFIFRTHLWKTSSTLQKSFPTRPANF